jgi:hypothetical protein
MRCACCRLEIGIHDRFCENCCQPQWVTAPSEARWLLRWVAFKRWLRVVTP